MSDNKLIAFGSQVKSEAKKVTWPVKKEVLTYTIVILALVAVLSAFFFISDFIILTTVQYVLGM